MAFQRVVSKVDVEYHHFEWKIEEFSLLLKDNGLLNSQSCEFETSVDGLEETLKWQMYLEKKDKRIGLWVTLLNCPDFWKRKGGVHIQCNFRKYFLSNLREKGKDERRIPEEFPLFPISSFIAPSVNGWEGFLDVESYRKYLSDKDGSMCITYLMKFIVSTPLPDITTNVSKLLKKFNLESTPKAKKVLEEALLSSDIPCNNLKIVTSDGKEFTAQWGILAARSPVFAKMYKANMTERKTGVIISKNISGKTMEVLRHFIYFGELLPAWKENDVVVELTNAAAMYELDELVKFLDGVLGRMCNEATAFQLLSLAQKLQMRKAEESLLEWFKKFGTNSAEGFFSILETLYTTDEDDNY